MDFYFSLHCQSFETQQPSSLAKGSDWELPREVKSNVRKRFVKPFGVLSLSELGIIHGRQTISPLNILRTYM
jgi:hypothetical protein